MVNLTTLGFCCHAYSCPPLNPLWVASVIISSGHRLRSVKSGGKCLRGPEQFHYLCLSCDTDHRCNRYKNHHEKKAVGLISPGKSFLLLLLQQQQQRQTKNNKNHLRHMRFNVFIHGLPSSFAWFCWFCAALYFIDLFVLIRGTGVCWLVA